MKTPWYTGVNAGIDRQKLMGTMLNNALVVEEIRTGRAIASKVRQEFENAISYAAGAADMAAGVDEYVACRYHDAAPPDWLSKLLADQAKEAGQ
jgi:hypothetical protein